LEGNERAVCKRKKGWNSLKGVELKTTSRFLYIKIQNNLEWDSVFVSERLEKNLIFSRQSAFAK